MRWLFAISLLCLAIVIGILWMPSKLGVGSRQTLTSNGNLLFYNSPVIAQIDDAVFLAYTNRMGQIIVDEYQKTSDSLVGLKMAKQHLVHDYSEKVAERLGNGDDHAAPAIIYNPISNELVLATSYHSSDLHVYYFNFKTRQFERDKTILGFYTYPRFINWNDQIILLHRSQLSGYEYGHLAYRSSSDDFTAEDILLRAEKDTTIYASRPFVNDGKEMYLTYSTYLHDEKRLVGWKAVSFNLPTLEVRKIYDLSDVLSSDYHSNRPTAIAVVDKHLTVGTAQTRGPKLEFRFAELENEVLISEFDLKSGALIKRTHSQKVTAPYYHTSIAMNEKGDFLYFDGKTAISSAPRSGLLSAVCKHVSKFLW